MRGDPGFDKDGRARTGRIERPCGALAKGSAGRRRRGLVFATVAMAAALASPVRALDFVEARFDFDKTSERLRSINLDAMIVADLTGGGSREIVVPSSGGRLHVLRLAGTARRPKLEVWATVETRVEGDSSVGNTYLTAGRLERGKPESLVLALPRGIFAVQIAGNPPVTRFTPFCDRVFFDSPAEFGSTERLDFLADLDNDGTPEIWIPQQDGMAFWRREAGGPGWQRIEMPPLATRTRQWLAAVPMGFSACQRPVHALQFGRAHRVPEIRLADIDRDKRLDLMVVERAVEAGRSIDRVECYRLRDALHFTTSPWQVREAEAEAGAQAFVDLNGDGFLDLLRVNSNFDFVKPRTNIEAYVSPVSREHVFVRPSRKETESRTYFSYKTHDPIGMVLYGDWNGDGGVDLAFTQLEYSFGSTDDLADIILGSEIEMTVQFLSWGPYGLPQKPQQSLRLRIRHGCFHPDLFPPLSMEGDYNGDGAADLLVRTRPERIRIHLAQKGGGIATRPSASISVSEDADCRVGDLNGDGRSDLLVGDWVRDTLSAFLSRP